MTRPDQCPKCGSLSVWYSDPKTGCFDFEHPEKATQVNCSDCEHSWPFTFIVLPMPTMTKRELWAENRRRRLAGLLEVDQCGSEIPKAKPEPVSMSPASAAKMASEIAATYDPNSSHYRRYQGD